MTATFETLWDAVKAEIAGLELTGLVDEDIRQQQVPFNPADAELTQGIFLCPVTEKEGVNGTNKSNDIGYGYGLTMLTVSNSALNKTAQAVLMPWREAIRKHFHNQSPLLDHGCYACSIEHAPAILPDAWVNQYDASALIVRCWVLEKGN